MSQPASTSSVIEIAHGVEPVRAWFNRAVDRVRVLGVLSSTCPMCVRGRRDGLEPMLAQSAEFRMAWIFIDMMPTDSAASAAHAAANVRDARLSVFHDEGQAVGFAIARCLGWERHVAWDTYLVYRPGTLWLDEDLPRPAFWYHQLKDREAWQRTAVREVGSAGWTQCLAEKCEADPAHFATGDDLRVAIAEAIELSANGERSNRSSESRAQAAGAIRTPFADSME